VAARAKRVKVRLRSFMKRSSIVSRDIDCKLSEVED
jgi:hypothetical protein